MNIFAISGMFLGTTSLLLAIFIIKFGSLRNTLHNTLMMLNVAITIWGFGCMMVGLSKDPNTALFWWKIAHIGGLYVSVLMLHSALIFTEVKRRAALFFSYGVATVFQIFSAANLLQVKMSYVFNLGTISVVDFFMMAMAK